MGPLGTLVDQLRRRLLGVSPEELRYTFEDVRREERDEAARAEVIEERAHGRPPPARRSRIRASARCRLLFTVPRLIPSAPAISSRLMSW